MTTGFPPPPPPPARGPERFQTPSPDGGRQRSSPLAAVGAFLALLLLVVGVPVGLVLWQGAPPYPTGLPSREDLTQPLSVDALLVVLLVVVWLAWLQFTICVVVEAVTLLKGGGLPRPVPLSGHSQALARALVGTILVGAAVVGSAGSATADDRVGPVDGVGDFRTVETSIVAGMDDLASGLNQMSTGAADPADRIDRSQYVSPDLAQASSAAVPLATPISSEPIDGLAGQKIVVVQPPQGRYHDNLWDIAERTLGDGRRWKEIFDLNKGRVQPDGQELVIGRLIQPGWVLALPEDATGVIRYEGVSHDQAQPPGSDVIDDGSQAGAPGHEATPDGPTGGSVPDRTQARGSADDDRLARLAADLAPDLLAGGLVAACLAGALLALRRRLRGGDPTAAQVETEVALLAGADLERADRLDLALRRLAAGCRAGRIPLPPIFAIRINDALIELNIAPPALDPPAPWVALDEGRRWCLDRAAGAADDGEPGAAPYPGLVCIGRDADGTDVLIDLEAVGGPAAITGSFGVAREVLAALAVQLLTAPWADGVHVHSHQLPRAVADIADGNLTRVQDPAAVVNAFEQDRPHHRSGEVLAGRLARSAGLAPQVLLLGAAIPPDVGARLHPMTSAGDRGLAVVSVEAMPGTRWQMIVDDAGHLSLPLLGVEVTAARLSERSADHLAGMLAKARERVAATWQRLGEQAQLAAPDATRPGDDAHWATSPVRIGVLGPLDVRVPAEMDPSRVELAREVVTFLALQPAPVHPSVLAGSVWPRGVTAEVRDATIDRVRAWLGTDLDGSYRLRENEEGRLFLADDVAVDWQAFCGLVQSGRSGSEETQREQLRRALQLVRGPLLAGHPDHRYSWLPRTRLETTVADAVESAAFRLADLSVGDPAAAAAAARAGLRLVPRSQVLWRTLLRSEYDAAGHPGLASVVDEMLAALAACGAETEPETEALVEELMPAGPPATAGT